MGHGYLFEIIEPTAYQLSQYMFRIFQQIQVVGNSQDWNLKVPYVSQNHLRDRMNILLR